MIIRGAVLPLLRATMAVPARGPELGDQVRLGSRELISRPELARFLQNTNRDLPKVTDFLTRHREAGVFVMGSARAQEGSEDFRLASELGRSLARADEEPISGGGPSLMEAVPRAFKQARQQIAPEENAPRTLAVALDLPFEDKVNPAVDDAAILDEFLFRKLALIRNSRAFLALPGGIGTLDEVFEVWSQTAREQHKGPFAFTQTGFWKPFLNTLYDVAVRDRQLIDKGQFDRVGFTDDHDRFLRRLPPWKEVLENREPIGVLAARLKREITHTVQILDDLPEAVTVMGGRGLADDDPACESVRVLSQLLTEDGIALRVGNPAPLARAVTRGARGAPVQALKLKGEEIPRLPGLKVLAQQTDFIAHRELLTRSARGLVYAPGGLGTMSNLFAVLTQIQTGKRPKVPIVLVGTSFWKPIFDSIASSMLSEQRHYISPEDLGLVTITDDPRQACAALTGQVLPR